MESFKKIHYERPQKFFQPLQQTHVERSQLDETQQITQSSPSLSESSRDGVTSSGQAAASFQLFSSTLSPGTILLPFLQMNE